MEEKQRDKMRKTDSWFQLCLKPTLGCPDGADGKERACQCRRLKRRGFNPWVGKMPWRRAWQTHSGILTWRISRTEEPDGLQPIGSQSDMTEVTGCTCTHKAHFMPWCFPPVSQWIPSWLAPVRFLSPATERFLLMALLLDS